MAEAGAMIASAVGNRVAIKLGELVNDEIALLWGFRDEVEGLEEKMKDLEAVMRDADNKLRRGEEDGEAVGRATTYTTQGCCRAPCSTTATAGRPACRSQLVPIWLSTTANPAPTPPPQPSSSPPLSIRETPAQILVML
ncbi:hypothetical protein TRIUR3_21496 [Triticum urartu]|uniref:Disease resistance N-terminal domain-containing protein n=1 Tax=Triticum urartu TaxID=4572 RepID=M7Z810_TRIUA|nr:hypothetical protein TRIUR3_21496 [Triticum urartu]